MKIFASYHLVTEKEVLQPVEPYPTYEFEAKDLNDAKEKVMEICENHGVMSDWCKRDPTSEWEDAPFDHDDFLFARRIFEFNTQYPDPRPRKAIIELKVY